LSEHDDPRVAKTASNVTIERSFEAIRPGIFEPKMTPLGKI